MPYGLVEGTMHWRGDGEVAGGGGVVCLMIALRRAGKKSTPLPDTMGPCMEFLGVQMGSILSQPGMRPDYI